MDEEARLGWRFVDVRDLLRAALRDSFGNRLGRVCATPVRVDGGVDLLVLLDHPSGRVLRVALDDVEIDHAADLWLSPPRRLLHLVPLPVASTGSLTER